MELHRFGTTKKGSLVHLWLHLWFDFDVHVCDSPEVLLNFVVTEFTRLTSNDIYLFTEIHPWKINTLKRF